MATPTLDEIRTRTKAATVKAELAWINRGGHLLSVRVCLMHRLYARISPTTPPATEPEPRAPITNAGVLASMEAAGLDDKTEHEMLEGRPAKPFRYRPEDG